MLANKTLTLLVGTLMIGAGAAGASSGALAAGLDAAWSFVAGAEVDASGAHELALGSRDAVRGEVIGLVEEALRSSACDEYAATDMPEVEQPDLDAVAYNDGIADGYSESGDVNTGLVDARAWSGADAAANGFATAAPDVPQYAAEKPSLDCSAEQEAKAAAREAMGASIEDPEVPTKFSHEEGLDGAAETAGDLSGYFSLP